jgi:hypothetical protein
LNRTVLSYLRAVFAEGPSRRIVARPLPRRRRKKKLAARATTIRAASGDPSDSHRDESPCDELGLETVTGT